MKLVPITKEQFDDELCYCGHSKLAHIPTNLDKHGGICEKQNCRCRLYTWARFVKYAEERK